MSIARSIAAVASCAAVAFLLASSVSAHGAPAPISKQKVTLVRQISKLDGQHASLRKRVRTCPSAATDLRVAARQRAAAMRGATVRASLRSLRAKRARMAAAVVRLSGAARRCATGALPSSRIQALPTAAGTAPVDLPTLMGGVAVDLDGLLGAQPLSQALHLVSIDELGGLLCSTTGVTCVGIDASLLGDAVRRLSAANLLASLLSLDLGGALSDVQALLRAGDLASLVRVERLGDDALRLVPIGPLAVLAGLPAVPDLPIGAIRVTP